MTDWTHVSIDPLIGGGRACILATVKPVGVDNITGLLAKGLYRNQTSGCVSMYVDARYHALCAYVIIFDLDIADLCNISQMHIVNI